MRDGPEETFVTCIAKGEEVGVDANGKVLTSLVMVPGREPRGGRRVKRWSKSLIVFRKALNEALIGSKKPSASTAPRTPPPIWRRMSGASSTKTTSPRVRPRPTAGQPKTRIPPCRDPGSEPQPNRRPGVRRPNFGLARNPGTNERNTTWTGVAFSKGEPCGTLRDSCQASRPQCPARRGNTGHLRDIFPKVPQTRG